MNDILKVNCSRCGAEVISVVTKWDESRVARGYPFCQHCGCGGDLVDAITIQPEPEEYPLLRGLPFAHWAVLDDSNGLRLTLEWKHAAPNRRIERLLYASALNTVVRIIGIEPELPCDVVVDHFGPLGRSGYRATVVVKCDHLDGESRIAACNAVKSAAEQINA